MTFGAGTHSGNGCHGIFPAHGAFAFVITSVTTPDAGTSESWFGILQRHVFVLLAWTFEKPDDTESVASIFAVFIRSDFPRIGSEHHAATAPACPARRCCYYHDDSFSPL